MNGNRCAGPLTIEAFREMGRRNAAAGDFALRFGISTPMLYVCMRLQSEQRQLLSQIDGLQAEVQRLQDELQRATEERDMLLHGHRILSMTLQSQPPRKVTPRKKGAERTLAAPSATPHLAGMRNPGPKSVKAQAPVDLPPLN